MAPTSPLCLARNSLRNYRERRKLAFASSSVNRSSKPKRKFHMALTKGTATTIPGAEQKVAPAALKDTTAAATAAGIPEAPAASTAMSATPAAAAAVVAQTQHAGRAVVEATDRNSFAALDDEIRYGSFPTIKLDKDKFAIGDKEEVDEFTAQILSRRPKWLFKAGRGTDKKDDQIFFSYDGTHDLAGTPVEQRLADWKADGLTQKETRKYDEVAVKMMDTSLAGGLALLNIPPVSVSKMAGFRRQMLALKNLELDKMVIKFSKGDKIKTKGGETFYPWNFTFVSEFTGEPETIPDEVE